MKRGLLTALMLSVYVLSSAQGIDSTLSNRYWVYKDRFLKFYTHVGGTDPGESLPMDVIRRNLNCGDFSGDRIESGDVMAAMFEYLGVLATEYAILKQTDDYEKQEACKHELYYAIRAIDRVDRFAEIEFFKDPDSIDTKGFFVRDDIRENYYRYWKETDNMAFHGAHATSGFVPDTTIITGSTPILKPWGGPYGGTWLWANDEFALRKTTEELYQQAPFNGFQAYKHDQCPKVRDLASTQAQPEHMRSNEMSQDHALGVLLGMKFIQKFINDETLYIQPTPSDRGMWVMAETRLIAERVMSQVSRKHANVTFKFPIHDTTNPNLPDTISVDFNSAGYLIINPVTGLPVARGWESFLLSGGYEQLGEDLTGNDYDAGFLSVDNYHADYEGWFRQLVANNIFKPIVAPAVNLIKDSANSQDFWRSSWNSIPSLVGSGGEDNSVLDNGLSMVMRLGAATGSWSHQAFATMATNNNYPWFELLYAAMNDLTPIHSKAYYTQLLDSAECSGVSKWPRHYVSHDSTPTGNCGAWVIDNTPTPPDTNYYYFGCEANWAPSQLASGIDTLYIYDTTWNYEHYPFNKSSIFSLPNRDYGTDAWVDGDFNGLDYMLLHNLYRVAFSDSLEGITETNGCPCESTVGAALTQVIDTLISISRFPTYRDIGIRVPEYITHSMDIKNNGVSTHGALIPQGDLTICGNLVRSVGGLIHLEGSDKSRSKELRVTNGGILELRIGSVLRVDSFSKVIIERGGTLIVRQGSEIVLDKGAVLEIRGNLEVAYDATFSITPGSFGQGYVKFVNNGENSSTANAKIIAQTFSKFNLSGPYKGYKIMEIAGSKPIVFPTAMKDSIWDGLIEMGANSTIEIQGSLYTRDLDVVARDTNTPYNVGFLTLGQPNIDIRHTDFSYGKVGISSHTYIGGKTPGIAEVNMYKMDVGVFCEGAGFNIQGEFDECAEAIYLVKPSEPGKVQNTRLEDGAIGITYDGQSTGSLRLRYGTVKNNQAFGMYGMNGSMFIECSTFDGNTDGLYLEFNPLVSINENQQAGGSIFKNAVSNVMYEDAGGFQLDLANGHSSFKNNTYLFDGYLKNHSALIPPVYPATTYKLSSSYNYWDFYTPYQYDLKYFIGNQGKLNAATVNLDHSNHYASEASLITKQSDLCPSYGTGSGQFQTTGAGSMFIDADNQIITNSYYTNAKLSDVFDDVNDVMYYQEEYLTAYNHAKSIFDFTLGPLSKFDQYVLSRIYRTMMEAYGHIMFDDGILIDKTGLTTELLGTMDDLEAKGQNPVDSFWVSQNLTINMDIAEVYRINDHRDTALSILVSTRGNLTEMDDIANIDNFICVIEAEVDVINGIKSPYEMEVMDCYTSGTVPPLPFSEKTTTKAHEDKPFVDWQPQPNPAETGVEVVFNLKTNRYVEIEIYDILGHKLVSQERKHYKRGQNTVSFDVRDWPTGMYFVKFNYDDYSDSKRLVIKR